MNQKQFRITRTSNHGTSHPVVARLLLQTDELIQWADLTKNEKDQVVEIYYGLKNRLLKMHEGYERLIDSLNTTIEECEFQEDGSSKQEPHVIGLEGEVETILYESKNYLRDLLGILKVYFDHEADEASYLYNAKGKENSEIVKWALNTFGEDDPFTTMLVSEHEWIEDIIRRRNAVEHPGGHSGNLYIQNFTLHEDNRRYILPTWNLNDDDPKGVYPDIEVTLDNLLTLAEDMLVSCNVHKAVFPNIQYVEVPEEERDEKSPVRIRVQLKEGFGAPK